MSEKMPKYLIKRFFPIVKMRGLESGSASPIFMFLCQPLQHLALLNANPGKMWDYAKPIGNKEELFKAIAEFYYNDIFISSALRKSFNQLRDCKEDLKEQKLRKKMKQRWSYSTNQFEFVYHITCASFRIRAGYDKLLLCVALALCLKVSSPKFDGRKNQLLEKIKNKQELKAYKKFISKLRFSKNLKEGRDGICHFFETKVDLFNVDSSPKAKKFESYFNQMNRDACKLHKLFIEFIEIITNKKILELKGRGNDAFSKFLIERKPQK